MGGLGMSLNTMEGVGLTAVPDSVMCGIKR